MKTYMNALKSKRLLNSGLALLFLAPWFYIAPVQAIIDHLLDFHLDHRALERQEDRDEKLYREYSEYLADQQDRDNGGASSGCSEGTIGPPDRDP